MRALDAGPHQGEWLSRVTLALTLVPTLTGDPHLKLADALQTLKKTLNLTLNAEVLSVIHGTRSASEKVTSTMGLKPSSAAYPSKFTAKDADSPGCKTVSVEDEEDGCGLLPCLPSVPPDFGRVQHWTRWDATFNPSGSTRDAFSVIARWIRLVPFLITPRSCSPFFGPSERGITVRSCAFNSPRICSG